MDEQTTGALAEVDLDELEQQARPFRALYDHWERTQWVVADVDLSEDVETFRSLSPGDQRGMIWIFAHRFHAEFNVATLLAPFLAAAPSYEMQLLLATQIADEYRHLQSVLRIYDEVFGIRGIDSVRRLADENLDPVAGLLYGKLEERVLALNDDQSEDCFQMAVFAYHLVAEGVIACTAQNLARGQYERLGFPGLAEGRRLVARDEARHIGIGVSYTRTRLREDPERAQAVLTEGIEEFSRTAARCFELGQGLEDELRDGYGVDSEAFYAEAMRLWQIRLRSIGYLDE